MEDWEVLGLDQNLNAARDARGPPDEAGAFEGEHHLMYWVAIFWKRRCDVGFPRAGGGRYGCRKCR